MFPLSNWTELDIWQYIATENVPLPSIYYAHRREVFRRDGMWLAVTPFITLLPGEEPTEMTVRFRTVGDATCTGAVESPAATVAEVITEVAASRITERGATEGGRQGLRSRHGRPQARGLLLMEMLRFATAGSVDDGKSTLIGRLLFDSKAIFEDQLEAVEKASIDGGFEYTELALLTDGLRAEREQGITIDVAYRYFATPNRKFIIADTPGHIQYTRNMVTGASTADLALVLIDARKGVLEQSRRHAFIASLLGIKHLVLCVNKMDLVDYDQTRFEEIRAEFRAFAMRLDVPDLTFVPISALHGDNVVNRSSNMAWYDGPSLLHHLEQVHIASDRNLVDVRFPVQYVIRPRADEHHDYRGYAGQMAGGVLKPGDEVLALPSGFTSTVASVETADGPVDEAFAPLSVTVRLADEIDLSRGDMLCRPHNRPHVGQDIDAMVSWMSDARILEAGRQAGDQAHHPLGSGAGEVAAVPVGCELDSPRAGRRRAGVERHRSGVAAHHGAAVLRRVPPQPGHGQLHPHRRGDQRHRRRRDDHRTDPVSAASWGGRASASEPDTDGVWGRQPPATSPVSAASWGGRASASEPDTDGVWGRQPPATQRSPVSARVGAPAPSDKPSDEPVSEAGSNIVWHQSQVARAERWAALGGAGATVWFTGLSGSGKSTIAVAVERELVASGRPAYLLDGDNLRHGLTVGLGFSREDRDENVRRVGEAALLFADAGFVALVSLVSPYRAARDAVRARHEAAGLRFVEVFVDTPIELCEQRDPKGLYQKARAGEIPLFTGVSDPYEEPLAAELVLAPDGPAAALVRQLVDQGSRPARRRRTAP